MRLITNYNAAPSTDKFEVVSVDELRLIKAEIRMAEKSSLRTEWAQSAWSTDYAGVQSALEMAEHGETVLVAQDEDGFYFATAVRNYGIERKAQ